MSSIDRRPPPAGGDSGQQRAYWLWHKYGLTPEKYQELLADQSGRCAICQVKMNRPFIDHDHESGMLRKLLCTNCNTGLGAFKDSIRNLANAIVYLEDHGKKFE